MNAYLKCVMVGSLCLALTTSVTLGIAQTTNGTIRGTVVDPNGATVASANVTARNVDTNIIQARTTVDGRFSFPGLPVGTYEVAIELAGFRKVRLTVCADAEPNAGVACPIAVPVR